MELTIAEQLLYSTVRIESFNNGAIISTGSGFYFQFNTKHGLVPAIVTNKHVIESAEKIVFNVCSADENKKPIMGKYERMEIDGLENGVLHHPDPEIDLAVFFVAPIFQNIHERLFYVAIGENVIPTADEIKNLDAIEEIVMIGYPNGIWDSANNLPIVRRGITATPIFANYENKKEFLIDAACFPGSSGSPVLLYNNGAFRDGKSNSLKAGTRVKLLGILYAGPQHTTIGEIHEINSFNKRNVSIAKMPNNLGIVIKSEVLLDFIPLINAI
jgi:hypothetical protein